MEKYYLGLKIYYVTEDKKRTLRCDKVTDCRMWPPCVGNFEPLDLGKVIERLIISGSVGVGLGHWGPGCSEEGTSGCPGDGGTKRSVLPVSENCLVAARGKLFAGVEQRE